MLMLCLRYLAVNIVLALLPEGKLKTMSFSPTSATSPMEVSKSPPPSPGSEGAPQTFNGILESSLDDIKTRAATAEDSLRKGDPPKNNAGKGVAIPSSTCEFPNARDEKMAAGSNNNAARSGNNSDAASTVNESTKTGVPAVNATTTATSTASTTLADKNYGVACVQHALSAAVEKAAAREDARPRVVVPRGVATNAQEGTGFEAAFAGPGAAKAEVSAVGDANTQTTSSRANANAAQRKKEKKEEADGQEQNTSSSQGNPPHVNGPLCAVVSSSATSCSKTKVATWRTGSKMTVSSGLQSSHHKKATPSSDEDVEAMVVDDNLSGNEMKEDAVGTSSKSNENNSEEDNDSDTPMNLTSTNPKSDNEKLSSQSNNTNVTNNTSPSSVVGSILTSANNTGLSAKMRLKKQRLEAAAKAAAELQNKQQTEQQQQHFVVIHNASSTPQSWKNVPNYHFEDSSTSALHRLAEAAEHKQVRLYVRYL